MNSPNSPAPSGRLSSIMQEDRLFPPSAEFSKRARIQSMEDYRRIYADAMEHPEKFWDNLAKLLPLTTPYTRVLDWQPPCASWFVGGRTNASAACLDQGAFVLAKSLPHGHLFAIYTWQLCAAAGFI